GDPNQLSQVLMNLCLNARDAMPEGGRLVLETANVTLDAEHARLHLDSRPGEFIRLRVTDTGCGMTPDVKVRIFEPFFTTKGPGMSGRDTFRKLREMDPEVRVVFASGYSSEQISDLMKDGSLGFVRKPYRPADLARRVREALDRVPARA